MSDDPRDDRPLCSVVLSVYNEELNLEILYERLAAIAAKEPVRWEFIFVDDGSKDRSFEILQTLHSRDPRVKIVRFSRNFGAHETAVGGLHVAAGDCAVLMASDLQDPPELIPSLLARWREGYPVVWAARTGRRDSFFRRLAARSYYAMIRKLGLPNYPKEGTGSFCLIGRPVIDAFNLLQERNRVTFELLVWCGFPSAEVPYERPPRERGTQSWTFRKNIKAAMDGLLALSYAPVQWVFLFGLCVALVSFGLGVYVVFDAILFGPTWPGWASIMVAVLFLGGMQLMCMGFLGEYLWRILHECRGRPLYVVRDKIGEFGRPNAPSPHTEIAPVLHEKDHVPRRN
jgi:dolichol-phosphate mannosyltransferase